MSQWHNNITCCVRISTIITSVTIITSPSTLLIKSKRDHRNSSFEIRRSIPAELSREQRFPVILWVSGREGNKGGTGRFRSCSRTIYFHGRMTHCAGLSLFGKILAIRFRSPRPPPPPPPSETDPWKREPRGRQRSANAPIRMFFVFFVSWLVCSTATGKKVARLGHHGVVVVVRGSDGRGGSDLPRQSLFISLQAALPSTQLR